MKKLRLAAHAVLALILTAAALVSVHGQDDPYQLALRATTRAELPTEPVYGWETLTSGIGYPEPRGPIEAQGHLSATYDANASRHLHVLCATPKRISGRALIECRLRFFHAQNFRLVGVHVTWRGGPVTVVQPSPAKLASSQLDGIYNDLMTEHMEDRYLAILLDTTVDPNDGFRALEIDVKGKMPDGRSDNIRLLGGKIEVFNARPTRKDVSGAYGAEYWLSNTATQTSTGYIHIEIQNPRRFDTDPYTTTTSLLGKGTNDLRRDMLLLATVNPNLHLHPTTDEEWAQMYGYVLTGPFDPRTSIGVPAPRRVQWSLDKDGTLQPSVKWLPLQVSQPTLNVGDRLMVRGTDPGIAADGSITRPEGTIGSLFVVTLGKGQ